ncbi:hypothetical protein [Desulfocastanea catecholica]
MTETKRGPGRPRKHADQRAKTRAWRYNQEKHRVDLYLHSSAYWRLKKLAGIWGCSLAGAVERLAIEADEKYRDLLFDADE